MRSLLLGLVLLTSCVSREQVEADVWQVKKIPAELCPKGVNHGFYRKIICHSRQQHKLCADGQAYYIERISFCADRAEEFLSMKNTDVTKWLDKLTKPRK